MEDEGVKRLLFDIKAEFESKTAELKRCTETVLEKSSEILQLEEENRQLNVENEQLRDKENLRVLEIQERLDAVETRNKRLEDDLIKALEDVESTKKRQSLPVQDCSKFITTIEALESELVNQNEANDVLEAQLRQLLLQIVSIEERVSELTEENENLKRKAMVIPRNVRRESAELEKEREEREEEREERDKLKREIKNFQKQLDSLIEEKKTDKELYDELDKAYSEKFSENESLQRENKRLRDEMEKLMM